QNLNSQISEERVKQALSTYGTVTKVQSRPSKRDPQQRFIYVWFETEEEATLCVREQNDKPLLETERDKQNDADAPTPLNEPTDNKLRQIQQMQQWQQQQQRQGGASVPTAAGGAQGGPSGVGGQQGFGGQMVQPQQQLGQIPSAPLQQTNYNMPYPQNQIGQQSQMGGIQRQPRQGGQPQIQGQGFPGQIHPIPYQQNFPQVQPHQGQGFQQQKILNENVQQQNLLDHNKQEKERKKIKIKIYNKRKEERKKEEEKSRHKHNGIKLQPAHVNIQQPLQSWHTRQAQIISKKFKMDVPNEYNVVNGVGIADSSVCFYRNESPQAQGEKLIVNYSRFGHISHIGDIIKENNCFCDSGDVVGLEGIEPSDFNFLCE
ncbi:MAG: hypothetical protein EZS28_022659, partial [Streblomastix strix]